MRHPHKGFQSGVSNQEIVEYRKERSVRPPLSPMAANGFLAGENGKGEIENASLDAIPEPLGEVFCFLLLKLKH